MRATTEMKNYLKSSESKVGMRVKVALPTKWCQVPSKAPFTWFKGTVIERTDKCILVNVWNRKWNIRIDRLQCFAQDGEYIKIMEIK